jgi:5-methylcytosine-specific restriction endonuclease McrA
MTKISRDNADDAKLLVEKFLNNGFSNKDQLLLFLANAIIFANGLNQQNWNLNLDTNGQFIRFNIGRVYCIQIEQERALILALKQFLPNSLMENKFGCEFIGYSGKKKKVISTEFSHVPNCLVTIPNSIGCYIRHDSGFALSEIEEANRKFIEYAIFNTTLSNLMNRAHSSGFITYLSHYCNKRIPNPSYFLREDQFITEQAAKEKEARKLTLEDLKTRVENSTGNQKADRTTVLTLRHVRNPFIAEYAKRMANGICQDCGQPAPFINKATNEPFLETHHIIRLADGGPDAVENTLALCPNCHRKRHYGY